MDQRGFIFELADALPECFGDVDLRAAYFYGEGRDTDSDEWGATVALRNAVDWLGDAAVEHRDDSRRRVLRPGADDLLHRFFAFVERKLAEAAEKGERTSWMAVELFEDVAWIDSALAFLGPRTQRLFRDSQDLR